MFLVTQVGLVGISFAGFEAPWRGIVLNDVVVPIDDPNIAVRSHLRHDRGGPLVVTGEQIERAGGTEIAAIGFQHEGTNQVSGRPVDEGGSVPILAGVLPGRVQRVTRCRRVSAMLIHLANVLGNRIKEISIRDRIESQRRRPTAHPFVVAVGNRHVDTRVAVGGRSKDQTLFADPQPPSVVVCRSDELHFRAVGTKAKETLAKRLLRLALDFGCGVVVSLHRPDPIVQAVLEIADTAVRVTLAPTCKDHRVAGQRRRLRRCPSDTGSVCHLERSHRRDEK